MTSANVPPHFAVLPDDLVLEAIDLLTGWAAQHDGHAPCRVPGCMVWSTRLERGMCPRALWDERHDAYDAALGDIPEWMRR